MDKRVSLEDVFESRARYCVEPCDALFGLASMPSESVDAMVTDPPAGIAFMGKAWDGNKGGRDQWIAWLAEIMREALRVLKPGAHALVWALPRTSHWTATALEDAGFEIRDVFNHLFATGFPKSANVSKLIDARAGAERQELGPVVYGDGHIQHSTATIGFGGSDPARDLRIATEAATEAAKQWDGFGTALKPAAEHWILARKPLGSTIAACVLKHGTGALNIDGCRIAAAPDDADKLAAGVEAIRARGGTMEGSWKNSSDLSGANPASPLGRWPANVLLSHSEWCEVVGTRRVKVANHVHPSGGGGGIWSPSRDGVPGSRGYADADGLETVESWSCVADCPVRLLDEQAGDRPSTPYRENVASGSVLPFTLRTAGGFSESGGPSRFFFTSKASRAEKDAGLDDFESSTAGAATGREEDSDGLKSPRAGAGRTGGAKNTHPTPKRVDLMRYLTRLVTPPKGLVLDPFTGSGSGGVAAMLEGMRFVGLELEPLHVDFARARIAHVIGGTWEREVKPARPVEKKQLSIFDMIGAVRP